MLAFNRLRIDPGDDSPVVEYRIEKGRVESRILETPADAVIEREWQQLTPEQLSSHVMADTVVARWLSRRMGIFPLIRACNQGAMSTNNAAEAPAHQTMHGSRSCSKPVVLDSPPTRS